MFRLREQSFISLLHWIFSSRDQRRRSFQLQTPAEQASFLSPGWRIQIAGVAEREKKSASCRPPNPKGKTFVLRKLVPVPLPATIVVTYGQANKGFQSKKLSHRNIETAQRPPNGRAGSFTARRERLSVPP